MAGKQNFAEYLKAAFQNRWNLLLLAGGTVASIIAPHTDIFLSLVAAGELALITYLASNPRFQRTIDAGGIDPDRVDENLNRRFYELYSGLNPASQKRFEDLRVRCESLRDLAVPRESSHGSLDKMADSQLQGVNRLLWVYLKLLHTRATLEQFFKSTNEQEITNLEDSTRVRLSQLPKGDLSENSDRKRRSLEDTLATATARKDNLKRARENFEYIELELERIAAKLTALSELAVNRQDPGMLTNEVDDVARSVEGTEQAIGELQVYSGLTQADMQAPAILTPKMQRVH